ncbi:hypothetical protein K431DRAFT_289020 [Polychaeton citri CBS 116435]|uniref:Thioesterase/thiol ester dehydrase-isomerase n=1 Tax=Polychaeton citri CBS 116435 TaxID=1314669 RepID=A0A9P4PXS6_9PEZI|nr:hypothetical protein K431DRAFT_289020 [Polychaeton citri CBS 116435]
MVGLLTASVAFIGLCSMLFLGDHIGVDGSKNILGLLAVVLALSNLKNLPGLWHVRVLRGIIYQFYFQPNPQTPKHLFAPMITSSYNTIYDCDYNLHKSNSTYFADLDVARAHYVGALIRTGLARLNRGDEEGLPQGTKAAGGRYTIALGGVCCFFQRQIEPLQGFEIFTRLLAWDRKWVYIVSHIVTKGKVEPEKYVLQPWKKGRGKVKTERQGSEEEDLGKHIFATSVARYVFKKGRLTINPEIVLERSHLLPTRPAGIGLPPRSESSPPDVTPGPVETPATNDSLTSPETAICEVSVKLGDTEEKAEAGKDADWSWDDMERERVRGLKIASHFEALSAAHGELKAREALGEYGDYW